METQVSRLNNRVFTLEGEIATLKGENTALNDRMDNLEGSFDTRVAEMRAELGLYPKA